MCPVKQDIQAELKGVLSKIVEDYLLSKLNSISRVAKKPSCYPLCKASMGRVLYLVYYSLSHYLYLYDLYVIRAEYQVDDDNGDDDDDVNREL